MNRLSCSRDLFGFLLPRRSQGLVFCSVRPLSVLILLAVIGFADARASAQTADLTTRNVDPAQVVALPNHRPQWANAANSVGPVPSDQPVEQLTLVLSRSPQRESAFQNLLADQQNPASPDYHHWLTPDEVGQRFGLSDADIGTITAWLQSQGLHVNWVTPSRVFVGFGGSAADVSRAFSTQLNNYLVHGSARISVASDPMIPAALSPVIKAVHGLYTIDEQPQHSAAIMQSDSPQMTTPGGAHFITPNDFSIIYNLPNVVTGAGETIGIVGRARTNAADFNNFKTLAGPNFTNPTEVVPTAYGGIDPGPAYTAPPGSGVSIDDQGEATLDVMRAGSVAPGAQLLLVVATSASGGVEADAEYLVNTTPVPAQVMTISFGACESAAGPAGVRFWDSLFQQAAAEGISSFVSSGDSGAAGCDDAFTLPPASPQANSPNYICSSSYATCVGGTEFNDASGSYWNPYDSGTLTTATGYIPEGGWNESWNGTTSTVAASGGGFSSIISTPSWQKGVPGVPAADAGRYSPDVSFSASGHDGYFACFAASGGSCAISNGSYYFSVFSGTSASAPSMAGIAALLDQNLAGAQGNLNPGLYQMWYGAPGSFHDVTLASSGITSCDITAPSMCNNSIPGPSGLSGGQLGYTVGTAYDEVTGLGSLNAATFVFAYGSTSKIVAPNIFFTSLRWPVNQDIPVMVWVNGTAYSPSPTGTVVLTAGSYTSAAIPLTNNGVADVIIPVGKLAMGSYTVTATYTPDTASALIYKPGTATGSLTLTAPEYITPVMVLSPTAWTVLSATPLTFTVDMRGGSGNPIPTGTVQLVGGGYTSSPATLVADVPNLQAVGVFNIPAGALAVGANALTVTYTPDAAASSLYLATSSTGTLNVVTAKITPTVNLSLFPTSITTAQALQVTVSINSSANTVPTGTVVLTSGTYTSPPVTPTLIYNSAVINVPAGALPIGTDTLTATYSGDSLYTAAVGSASVAVSAPVIPSFTVASTPVTVTAGGTTGNTSFLTITPSGGFAGSVTLSAAVTASPANVQHPPTLTFGNTGTVTIANNSPATATLTISTTASHASSCSAANSAVRGIPWYGTGGAVLTCFVLFGIPLRRRRGRTFFTMLLLLGILLMSADSCGSGGSAGGGTACNDPATAGTTAGVYTVTVTGTSGKTTTIAAFSLTVQ